MIKAASRSGVYLLSGHDGPVAVERFTCGEDLEGWRYVGSREHPATGYPLGRIELLVDAAGRITRLEVTAGGWQLRGGVVGPDALWRRGDEEHSIGAHGFTGTSPAFAIASARLASSGVERQRLVAVADEVLATLTVDQTWTRAGDGWGSTDLATGGGGRWRIAGDVVRAGPGVRLLDPDTLLAELSARD